MTKDPKSSYRWENPDRYGAHIVARVQALSALTTLRVENVVSLVEFLKELQATQGVIVHQEHLQVVEKDSSSSTRRTTRRKGS